MSSWRAGVAYLAVRRGSCGAGRAIESGRPHSVGRRVAVGGTRTWQAARRSVEEPWMHLSRRERHPAPPGTARGMFLTASLLDTTICLIGRPRRAASSGPLGRMDCSVWRNPGILSAREGRYAAPRPGSHHHGSGPGDRPGHRTRLRERGCTAGAGGPHGPRARGDGATGRGTGRRDLRDPCRRHGPSAGRRDGPKHAGPLRHDRYPGKQRRDWRACGSTAGQRCLSLDQHDTA